MTGAPSQGYLHGTAREEQARLSLLNDLLNDASLRELDLRGGERILDIGCGLGQLTRRMARIVGPSGFVVGIDQSAEQLAEARRLAMEAGEGQLVDWRRGEASAPPLSPDESGSFDVAHARFVLEHVPDPLVVVREMVRAVRPGGRIVLQDDDHDMLRLWPEPPGAMAAWQAYIQAFERNGTDPYVGRRLVSLLLAAGAAPVRNAVVFWGACVGMPTFDSVVTNTVGLLRGARSRIVPGILDAPAFDGGVRSLEAWRSRPDAAFWFAVPWASGVRPR